MTLLLVRAPALGPRCSGRRPSTSRSGRAHATSRETHAAAAYRGRHGRAGRSWTSRSSSAASPSGRGAISGRQSRRGLSTATKRHGRRRTTEWGTPAVSLPDVARRPSQPLQLAPRLGRCSLAADRGAGARRARPRAGAAPVRAVLSSLPAPAVVGAGAGVSHDRPAQRTSRCSPGSVPLLSRPSRLVDLATATTGGPLTGHRLRSNRGHTSEASLHPLLRGLERATPPSRRRPRRPDPESSRGASLDRAPACFSRRHTHRHRRSRPARRLRIGRCDYAAGTVTGSWLAPPGAADVAKSFWRMRNPQPMAATKASTAPIASTSFKPLTRP